MDRAILPKVKGAAVLVAGYWVDPADGQGFGFLVFENEEQAVSATVGRHFVATHETFLSALPDREIRKFTPPATNWCAPG
jgi:hypothetical protein